MSATMPQGGIPCQRCGYRFDATTCTTDAALLPADGDLSICLACGELAIFAEGPDGLTLRPATADERADALCDDSIVRVLLARQEAADASADWPTANTQRSTS